MDAFFVPLLLLLSLSTRACELAAFGSYGISSHD
jgi:hypothetical protein